MAEARTGPGTVRRPVCTGRHRGCCPPFPWAHANAVLLQPRGGSR